MARFNFCGGTYQSISPVMDAEFCMNLYPEAIEASTGRSAMALIQSEGLAVFASLPAGAGQSVPGIWSYLGRTFLTGIIVPTQQLHLYELLQTGQLIDRGALGAPVNNSPAIWAANPNQVVFTVAGTGAIYVLNLATNAITTATSYADTGGMFAAAAVCYMQGFFVAFLKNSNVIQLSNLEDGTTWLAINIGQVSEFADQIVSMVPNELIVWFLGQKQSMPYQISGALFPLTPIPGALVEEGSAATYGPIKIDNTICWIGANADQGGGIAWRMNGYTPTRISTHAVETFWQSYPTIADAVSFTYQIRGHKFWEIYFPTANASWVYDIATGVWHQRGNFNRATGQFGAHNAMCHTFNFGMHLVGDCTSGNIYSLSGANLTDAGKTIRRVRRAPYIAKEHDWLFHRSFELLAEMGLGPMVPSNSEYPVAIYLADSNNMVWKVELSDGGIPVPSFAPAGTAPQLIILADNVNQSTFWQLAITPGGGLYGIGVSTGRADVAIRTMATNGQFLDCGLQVNQQGIVSGIQPQPHLREPQVQLRWSDDGGHSWSNYYNVGLGKLGEFTKRAIWRRLGRSRNRVYEVAFDDPATLRIVDAFVDADPAYKATERLASQLSKMA